MIRPVAQAVRAGVLYELRSDGSLYRMKPGGWELVPGRMSDWPEVSK